MSNLKYLDGIQWRTRSEMAAYLNVSERTVTRRVNRGELVRREQAGGNLYRLAESRDSETGHGTGRDRTPPTARPALDDPPTRDTPRDTGRDGTGLVEKLADRLEARHARIVELTADLERTRGEIVTYQTRAHLERGRRELAEERLADALAEIERMRAELAEHEKTGNPRPWWSLKSGKKGG